MKTLMPVLLLIGVAGAQDAKPTPPPEQPGPRAMLEQALAKEGIKLDTTKGTVSVDAEVTVTSDYLEYVLIGPAGKKHEALVTVKCKGSTLSAALVAIGLDPKDAKNVDFKPVEPLPSEEEVMKGAPTSIVVPPHGPRVYLSLAWRDDKGVEKTYDIEDLLIDLRAENTMRDAEWIFFGGMMAPLLRGEPPVFVADYEQNYISTYYAKPDSHLITLKHERARLDDNWWPFTDRLPPRGTPCTLILSKKRLVDRLPPLKKESQPEKGK